MLTARNHPRKKKGGHKMTDYRHEWKIEVSWQDLLILHQRLRCVLRPDAHAVDGRYLIRSLYFDTLEDRALREKIDGVSRREKFRIRYYNGDTSCIHLEKKTKIAGLGCKDTANLTPWQVQAIVDGNLLWMAESDQALITELYGKMRAQRLKPRTIVDYTREPFVYAPGNVRVTLDYDIRTGLSCTDFLNAACPTVPVPDSPAILEVKWDAFLPDVVRDAVQMRGRRAGAFSKYAACRSYD